MICDYCLHDNVCGGGRWITEASEPRLTNCADFLGWIPVSKGLPKENGYYLTTTIHHEVYCDYWEEDHFNRTEAVIAWMPKPEPYKAENEG